MRAALSGAPRDARSANANQPEPRRALRARLLRRGLGAYHLSNQPKSAKSVGFGPKSSISEYRTIFGISKTVRQTAMVKNRRFLSFNPRPYPEIEGQIQRIWSLQAHQLVKPVEASEARDLLASHQQPASSHQQLASQPSTS